MSYDVVIVGAGIVGLGHAAAALRRGLKAVVIERDDHAVGASIRNFGHICTTAQSGPARDYALVARERWLDLADAAGLWLRQAGTVIVARTEAEQAVLEEFSADRGAAEVRLLTKAEVAQRVPGVSGHTRAGAWFPLDLRLDARAALPALAAHLERQGVEFRWRTTVHGIEPGRVATSRGEVRGERVFICVGHDVDYLAPDVADAHQVRRCRLHMARVADPGVVIEPGVLTGLSMLRYDALAAQPSAAAVRAELQESAPELLDVVMNLMFTQRPDGSLIVGDTHDYALTPDPFGAEWIGDLVLQQTGALLGGRQLRVLERWQGIYASSAATNFVTDEVAAAVRAVSVTSGIGMTTGFGLAEAMLAAG